MFSKERNPSEGGWHLGKVDGQKQPLMWNAPNQFWTTMAGKTYKPEEIDGWFDDRCYYEGKNLVALHTVQVNGKKEIMRWNAYDKIYSTEDGRKYTPEQIDGCFDDEGKPLNVAEPDIEARKLRIMVKMQVRLNDEESLSPKEIRIRMDEVGEEVKRRIWSSTNIVQVKNAQLRAISAWVLPEMQTLAELEAEGAIN